MNICKIFMIKLLVLKRVFLFVLLDDDVRDLLVGSGGFFVFGD